MITGQRGEFVYWRDGQYVMDEYYALSALGQDHQAHEAVQIEPRVFDLMFATQAGYFGSECNRTFTELTSAYRTPATNKAVSGAPSSKHLEGKAAASNSIPYRRACSTRASRPTWPAIELELELLRAKPQASPPQHPKRARSFYHEPFRKACKCGCELKRVGEDVSKKRNSTPSVFTVEHHIRGK